MCVCVEQKETNLCTNLCGVQRIWVYFKPVYHGYHSEKRVKIKCYCVCVSITAEMPKVYDESS